MAPDAVDTDYFLLEDRLTGDWASGCFVVDGLASCPSTRQVTGAAMRVMKVLDPASDAVSFTLINEAGVVQPADRYLRYLADTERSPNTIKAHAHDLKDWFVFLGEYGRDWQSVKLEDVGAFIRWLRRRTCVARPSLCFRPLGTNAVRQR